MADWLNQYSAALDLRDAQEQAHKRYIDAYTALADRTSAVAATTSPPPASPAVAIRSSTPVKGKVPTASTTTPTISAPDVLTSLRADLATTQKARAALSAQVTELTASVDALQKATARAETEAAALRRQKVEAERRLRDREEEIRGKAGLVQQAQDEMVALELQLNLSEQKQAEVKRDYEELLERWMKKMGEEADKVNRDSKWE